MRHVLFRAALLVALLATLAPSVHAQTFSARRLAMGGVLVPHAGGSDEANVALRALPRPAHDAASLTLPLGLLALAQNAPVLDPDDPEFNAYELANTLFNPPWNLQLGTPEPPSTDVTVAIARDRLSVQLGEISSLFPSESSVLGVRVGGPAFGVGMRGAFAEVAPLVHAKNEMVLNDALHGVLASGADFATNTRYETTDRGVAQAAAALRLGWAGRVAGVAPADSSGRAGLYAGARVKLLRGLAYADADHVASFTTGDTLFGDAPVALDVLGRMRTAGPGGGGFGAALDAGLVWAAPGVQVGVGVTDAASELRWRVRESEARRDSATGEVHSTTLREHAPWSSHLPAALTAHIAWTGARHTVSADVVTDDLGTTSHAGMERWFGAFALRAGVRVDREQRPHWSGGLGARLGRVGLDLAAATHTRNLMREEQSELALGLSWYPKEIE